MNILAIIQALLPAFQIAGPILGQLVPTLLPIITGLGNTNPTSHNSIVTFLQEAINALAAVGVITLAKPLVVDGQFGGATFAAIKLLQTKFGLGVLSTEPIASLEYTLLSGFLAQQVVTTSPLAPVVRVLAPPTA